MEREQPRRAITRHGRIGGAMSRAAMAVALLAAMALAAPVSAAPEPAPRFFRIATAATTGTYFVIGAEIANAISKPPGARDCAHGGSCGVAGLVAVAQATQGSIENALLVGSGQVEAAFIAADVARWAYSGRSPRVKSCRGAAAPESGTTLLAKSGAIDNLRAIAALFPEGVHLVARADAKIRMLADLKGKRVAMGEPGSGTLAEARLVLEAVGLSECRLKPQYPRLSEAAAQLERGTLDAFFVTGGEPVPAISDVASMIPVRLIPVIGTARTKLERQFGLSAMTIPGATYPGIDAEIQTIGTTALFVVSADAPEELVYEITKALWQDATRRILDNGHPAGRRIRFENALKGITIPLHPGALRYYKEAGLNPQN
ncbi:MAG: TAXI family TRAP transporter solute-binding subunit [Stellaceae bacterium]